MYTVTASNKQGSLTGYPCKSKKEAKQKYNELSKDENFLRVKIIPHYVGLISDKYGIEKYDDKFLESSSEEIDEKLGFFIDTNTEKIFIDFDEDEDKIFFSSLTKLGNIEPFFAVAIEKDSNTNDTWNDFVDFYKTL